MDYTEDLHRAIDTLKTGGVIAYPTDTVWGIGCDACDSNAVKRIFDIKHRPDAKAMITLVSDVNMLAAHVSGALPSGWDRLVNDNDRPLTVVYPGGRDVSPLLLAADGSLGIRVVKSGFAHDLCRMYGHPIVSTSANISGKPSPAIFGEISGEILGKMDYVVESGRDNNAPSRPSRVVKIDSAGNITILRD